ncbi:MAG: restriction endonuclease subunit S, partial [Candidatus Angelobacter sp.]
MHNKLPKGWVRTTLGEVCKVNPGMPTDVTLPDDTEVSFVPMAAVEEESGRLDASQIRALGSVRRGYTPFIENDVIFAKITPCMENGKIAIATDLKNRLGYGSTEFFVFRPFEGVIPRFVLYFLLQPSFRKEAEHQMTGASGQKRVPANYLVSHEFPLPSTREQERIIAKLDAGIVRLDRAEIVAQRARERLKRYREAVLEAAGTGDLTRGWRAAQTARKSDKIENGKALLQRILAVRRARWEKAEVKRFPKGTKSSKRKQRKFRYSEPSQLDTTGLPQLPETWAWASLEMVAGIGSGISVSKNRLVKNPVELPYLRVANVMRGYFDLSEIKTIRLEKDRVADYLLRAGDILFTEGGDRDKLGRGWVWEDQIRRCVHQNHVFRVRPFEQSLLNPKLVSHWGNTFGQSFFIKHGTQTTNLASINRGVLSKLPIPIPPLEEQAEIIVQVERRLAAANRLDSKLSRQLELARTTRDSLLRQAFTGELVPQDQQDEPATLLLDRIDADKNRKEAERREARRGASRPKGSKKITMQPPSPSPEALKSAWQKIGKEPDARRLFDEAEFSPEQVVHFYEALRAVPALRTAFEQVAQRGRGKQKPASLAQEKHQQPAGRFRLVE